MNIYSATKDKGKVAEKRKESIELQNKISPYTSKGRDFQSDYKNFINSPGLLPEEIKIYSKYMGKPLEKLHPVILNEFLNFFG